MTSAKELLGDFQAGDIVGDTYMVLGYLGKGSMGHVYHVRHKMLKTDYALKTLSGDEVNDQAWKRFQIEAQTIAMMNHPNVVGIYNYGLHERTMPYYAMDLLQGIDLGKRIGGRGPLEVTEAVQIFIEVCAGISYAHGKGIIHRDIKPGNVFLLEKPGAKGETIKVVDFGMVKLTEDKSQHIQSLTGVGIAVGTPHYMSPEQCMGAKVDARSDIYSLGCTLFEALTGGHPFRGRNVTEIMMLHVEAPPFSLYRVSGGKEFPPALEHIIATTLAKPASERYQTAEQLAEALTRLLEQDLPLVLSPGKALTSDVVGDPTERAHFEAVEAAPTMRVSSIVVGSKKRLLPLVLPVLAGLIGLAGYVYWQSAHMAKAPRQAALPAWQGQKSSAVKALSIPPAKAGLAVLKSEHQGSKLAGLYPTNQIVTASLMIQRPFSTITQEAGIEYRSFNFPKDVVIGLISSSSGGPPVRAVGELKFPTDELITFTPADVLERYPKCLKRFQSGDIYCVKFLNDHDSDDLVGALSTIPEVQMLDFDQCWDMTPACVTELNKFDHLKVFSCPYSVFDGAILPKAKCWDKLEVLDLADFEKITPMLQSIKGFKQLRKLTIKGTDLNQENFKDIASLSKLTYLNLDGTYVTERNLNILSTMPDLTQLDLQNTGIDASSSGILKKFKALKTLYIKSGKLKPGQFEKLKAALPGLTIS